MIRRTRTVTLALAVTAAVLAGCGYEDTPVPAPATVDEYTPAPPSDCDTDPATLASEPADSTVAPGSTVAEIRAGDRPLRIGISADTNLMAARDPATNAIQGFDIEIVKAIGEAIFGPTENGFNLNADVQLRVITAADRIDLLKNGELDLVVRNFTINSCRKEEIAFSAVYYEASQKVLVGSDLAASYTGVEALAGKRVCAPNQTTSLDRIAELQPEAELVPASTHTGCLIKFQRGEVDAITGDDTVLAGLAAQDPYAVVPPGQEPLSEEPYGVGVNKDDPDLVAFVNYALEQMVESEEWLRQYDKWLAGELGPGSPPEAIR